MTIVWDGTAAEARAAVGSILEAAGWVLRPISGESGLFTLSSGDGNGLGCAGFVAFEDDGRVRFWLPNEVDSEAVRRLEEAVDAVAGSGEEVDAALLRRLKRIEGQVRGLRRMIASGRDCEAVLTQFSAVTAALKQTAATLVADHLLTCVRQEIEAGGDGSHLNQRLLKILL